MFLSGYSLRKLVIWFNDVIYICRTKRTNFSVETIVSFSIFLKRLFIGSSEFDSFYIYRKKSFDKIDEFYLFEYENEHSNVHR